VLTDQASLNLSNGQMVEIYRTMVSIRAFENQVYKMFKAGLTPGLVHLYSGQEAIGAGAIAVLNNTDYIASHHRGHGHCLAKGSDPVRLFAEILGRRDGYGLGRGGSMHIYDPDVGNLGTNGIVGGSVPLATGAALTAKLTGSKQVAVSFFGDGVLNQGILFETFNLAAVWDLPVIFVCENNGYGEFTETDKVTAGRPYTKRGEAFDIPVAKVDGMDILAVYAAMTTAVDRARDGNGPSFMVCDTGRFTGHHAGDAQDYVNNEVSKKWRERDPIPKLAKILVAKKIISSHLISDLNDEIQEGMQSAADEAKRLPEPGPDDFWSHVYAP
jgi:TPP-dependent pyruvate/acetoin dehydrogenase alpha subunit